MCRCAIWTRYHELNSAISLTVNQTQPSRSSPTRLLPPGPETSWTSDTEFVREASNQKDGSWKNNESEERPLIDLTEVSTTEAPLRKKREELLKDAEEEEHRRKRKTERRSDDEEQPGPSSLLIPSQRKESKKICFCKSPPTPQKAPHSVLLVSSVSNPNPVNSGCLAKEEMMLIFWIWTK